MYPKYSKLMIAAGLLLPLVATAAPLNYNFIDVDYFDVEVDGAPVSDSGFSVGGSAEFAENFFFAGRYADTDPLERVTAGVGAKTTLAPATSIYGLLSFENIDAKVADDNGFGVEAGLRQAVTNSFEVSGALQYYQIDDVATFDDEFGFKIGGLFNFNDNFGIEAGYNNVDDYEEITVGGRMTF